MSEKVKYVVPLEITDSMIVSSNAYDVPPALYPSGAPFALGGYTAVSGTLGEVLIYKNILADDGTHPPATSPTYWEYSSSTYEVFNIFTAKGFDAQVLDTDTKSVYQSLAANTQYRPLVFTNPSWSSVGNLTYVEPALVVVGTAYIVGDIRRDTVSFYNPVTGVTDSIHEIYRCIANDTPASTYLDINPNWERAIDYPRPVTPSTSYSAGSVVIDGAVSGKGYIANITTSSSVPFENETAAWVRVKTGNRSAMFDSYSSSQTSVNKSIKVQLTGAFATAIGFLNTNADAITVNIYTGVGGTLVYTNTTGLGSAVTNAWDYYFTDPSVKRKQAYLSGLPASAAYLIEVELTGTDMVNLGHLILGTEVELGYAEYGLTSDITDFSRKVTDDFGRTTFVKRGFKRNMELQMLIPNENLTAVENRLEEIRSTPILVLASDNPYYIETVLRFCFYKTFRTEISYPTFAFVSIQFEGLI